MINIDDRQLGLFTESELWLMIHIAKHMGADRNAFPSNETLLKSTGWGKDKLRKNKLSLERKKLMNKKPRYTGEGKQTSNNYNITTNAIGVFVSLDELTNDLDKDPKNKGLENQTPTEKTTPLRGSENQRGGGSENQTTEVLTTISINSSSSSSKEGQGNGNSEKPNMNGSNEQKADYLNQILADQVFIENSSMNLGIKMSELTSKIEEFHREQEAKDDFHPRFSDYKRHCWNWLRINSQISNKKGQGYGKGKGSQKSNKKLSEKELRAAGYYK